ncbi:MAG: hypothetical protein [Caudoviricetes sp.]|nr:MAG: hypothetical protein [Caudoviricetes sp.]
MAFKELKFGKYASDLLIDHPHFKFGMEDSNITPGAQPFVLGTIVHRPKDSLQTVAWTAVAAGADVVDTNEFAVIWGDHYAFKEEFTPKAIAAGKWNSIVARKGAFKEFYIKANYKTVLAADYAKLLQLMANQGMLVLTDTSDHKVA